MSACRQCGAPTARLYVTTDRYISQAFCSPECAREAVAQSWSA